MVKPIPLFRQYYTILEHNGIKVRCVVDMGCFAISQYHNLMTFDNTLNMWHAPITDPVLKEVIWDFAADMMSLTYETLEPVNGKNVIIHKSVYCNDLKKDILRNSSLADLSEPNKLNAPFIFYTDTEDTLCVCTETLGSMKSKIPENNQLLDKVLEAIFLSTNMEN